MGWIAKALIKGINLKSLSASLKLKEHLLEFSAITWKDIHNRYSLKIRVKFDQFSLPHTWAYIARHTRKKYGLRLKVTKENVLIILLNGKTTQSDRSGTSNPVFSSTKKGII